MPVKPGNVLLLLCCVFSLYACQTTPDYHLIYPNTIPDGVKTMEYDVADNELIIHYSWAIPRGEGPFPTVMVHPHGGKTTEQMQGIIWDLASRGYVAVAVDYKRYIDGEFQRNTFVWSTAEQSTRALRFIRQSKLVDPDRVAALGFSQGGMLSLIIAARASDQLKTVIAFYPVADFNEWFDKPRGLVEGLVFNFILSHFYSESGAKTDKEFRMMLKRASPMTYVKQIDVPVLLIHGDADTSARHEESEKLYTKLQEYEKEAKLIIVPDAVHIFNFRQPLQARLAWSDTLAWLKEKLK
jgi:dipeptidyl aminopeptidase/acylaminoacyl peptidase